MQFSEEMRYVATLCEASSHEVAANAVPPDALSEVPAKALYQACMSLAGKEHKLSTELVVAELEEMGIAGSVGGSDAIFLLVGLHGGDDRKNARTSLLRAAERRTIREVGEELVLAASAGRTLEGVAAIEAGLQRIQRFTGSHRSTPFKNMHDYLAALTMELSELSKPDAVDRPKASMGSLTKTIGSPRPGTAIAIGGYSSAGKSYLMQHTEGQYAAIGLNTLRLSLEDAESVNAERYAAEAALEDFSERSTANASRLLRSLLAGTVGFKADVARRRFCVTPRDRSVHSLCRDIRRASEEHGIKVAFVDYIQEVRVDNAPDVRTRVMTANSMLKEEAIRLGITIVIGSQLRKLDSKAPRDYQPSAHDLKEAGELHNSSEVVLVLWKAVMNGVPTRVGKIDKDKIAGTYGKFIMNTGPGGAVHSISQWMD